MFDLIFFNINNLINPKPLINFSPKSIIRFSLIMNLTKFKKFYKIRLKIKRPIYTSDMERSFYELP